MQVTLTGRAATAGVTAGVASQSDGLGGSRCNGVTKGQ
jgi:hypothetical protein